LKIVENLTADVALGVEHREEGGIGKTPMTITS
jgi:hypothetical protein